MMDEFQDVAARGTCFGDQPDAEVSEDLLGLLSGRSVTPPPTPPPPFPPLGSPSLARGGGGRDVEFGPELRSYK